MTALLTQVVTPPEPFKAQEISNLLWALAKLADNGQLQLRPEQPGQPSSDGAVAAGGDPSGTVYLSGHISNLLWTLAKLVDNGQLHLRSGQPGQPGGNGAVAAGGDSSGTVYLSTYLQDLLWTLAKLVENGRLHLNQGSLVSQAVTALLPQVVTPQEPFKPQEISNLLWALAKLVENGRLHLDQGSLARQAVTALLPQVQSNQDNFTSQGISNLLWALAALGDGVRLNEVLNILRTMNINMIELSIHREMTLWALTVFLARSGEENLLLSPMKRLYDSLKVEIGNGSDTKASIMWVSGFWLKQNLLDLPQPYYESTVSPPHRNLHAELKRNFPRHTLEMEVSVHGLSPVDLLFPDEKVAIEVQGAHHYVDKEKTLRNGRTILKANTYRKLGYKVFEIPASDVGNTKKQELLLREIQTSLLNLELRDNADESDDETTVEDEL